MIDEELDDMDGVCPDCGAGPDEECEPDCEAYLDEPLDEEDD